MYVAVAPSGTITFRLDYRLNGRRETVTFGKYGPAGLSLAAAREKCIDARTAPVAEGRHRPMRSSARSGGSKEAKSFGEFGRALAHGSAAWPTAPAPCGERSSSATFFLSWRQSAADRNHAGRSSRALRRNVKRGAPATAIHVRDIVKQIYGFAILHGEKVANPADEVGPASIATFVPKDRSLSPTEIRIMLKQLEHVPTLADDPPWACG